MPIYQYVRYIGSTLAVSVDGGLVKDALAGVRGDQYLMARLSICSAADLLPNRQNPKKSVFKPSLYPLTFDCHPSRPPNAIEGSQDSYTGSLSLMNSYFMQ